MISYLIDFVVIWASWFGIGMFCVYIVILFKKKEERKPLKTYTKIPNIIAIILATLVLLGNLIK